METVKVKKTRKTKLASLTSEERLARRRAQVRESVAKSYANNRIEIRRRRNASYPNKGTSRGRPLSEGVALSKKVNKDDKVNKVVILPIQQ